jgi:hypothetical protein
MWFKVINAQQSPTPLLNATFIPTGKTVGKKFSIVLYTQGSSVYVNISGTVKLLYNNLKVGQPYFINFTNSSLINLSQAVKFTIYDKQGNLLNSTVMGLPSKINGYTLILTFGTKTVSNGIYQAFMETGKYTNQKPPDQNQGGNFQGQGGDNQNQGSTNPFWYISRIVLHNGPLYNNTYLFNWTVAHSPNLNSSAYWYFVWPYNSPPPQLPGILWYWPSSKSNYPYIYYIPEKGTNTYVIA